MSTKKEGAAIIGVGAAASAACCAGPILGILAAVGVGTAAGFAAFGGAALAIGALAVVVVLRRRRRGAASCAENADGAPGQPCCGGAAPSSFSTSKATTPIPTSTSPLIANVVRKPKLLARKPPSKAPNGMPAFTRNR
jgi:hypothetical protein